MVCDVSRCNRVVMLTYDAFVDKRRKEASICQHHWDKHCDEGDAFDIRVYFQSKQEKKNVQG